MSCTIQQRKYPCLNSISCIKPSFGFCVYKIDTLSHSSTQQTLLFQIKLLFSFQYLSLPVSLACYTLFQYAFRKYTTMAPFARSGHLLTGYSTPCLSEKLAMVKTNVDFGWLFNTSYAILYSLEPCFILRCTP